MNRNCDKKKCNFALLLPEIQELRRIFFLRSLKHISCLHCYHERSKCSPVAVTHSVRWWRAMHDGMVSRHPINKQSWILCLLYQQCQFNKVDSRQNALVISTSYFKQGFVFFCLRSWVNFCWKLCEITVFSTLLSLVPLQAIVYKHVVWSG